MLSNAIANVTVVFQDWRGKAYNAFTLAKVNA
jgi:hypothetical protein